MITISGWATPYDSLSIIAPNSLHFKYEHFTNIDETIENLPNADIFIGWSLGANIIMRAIEASKISPKKIILIAPSLQFVSCKNFPYGMQQNTFELFKNNYKKDPIRTAKKFVGLITKDDIKAKEISLKLNGSDDANIWHKWLNELDSPAMKDFSNFPETIILHGRNDRIINHKQSEILKDLIPNSKLISIKNAGHAPHLHNINLARQLLR